MGNNKRFPTPHASSHDLRFRNGILVSVDPLLVAPVPFIPVFPTDPIHSASSLADMPDPVAGVIDLSGVWLIQGIIDLEGNRVTGGSLYGRSPAVDGFRTTSAQVAVGAGLVSRLSVENAGAGGALEATVCLDCFARSAGGTVVVGRDVRGCVVDATAAAFGVRTLTSDRNILLRNRIAVSSGGLAIDTNTNFANIMGQNVLQVAAGGFGLDSTGPAGVGAPRQAYVGNLKVGGGLGFGPGTMPVDPTRGGLRVMYSGNANIVADSGAVDAQGGNPVPLDPQFETLLLLANAQTVELPPAATVPGKTFRVKSRLAGAGTFTLQPDGAELIDGAVSLAQGARGARRIRCDGAAWFSF